MSGTERDESLQRAEDALHRCDRVVRPVSILGRLTISRCGKV